MRHVIVQTAGFAAADKRPAKITGHDGQVWLVEDVLEYWDNGGGGHPRRTADGHDAEAVRWRLEVTGPLPRRPAERGHQEVILSSFATGSGWWMGLAALAPPPGEVRYLGSR